jgi:arabinose-5-phosphate isomerase
MKKKNNEIAIEVINLQIKSLKKLRNTLDDNFSKAVKEIIKCKSKVIICGVGKSGKIASKISATLSSVGTPSFSISASDCSHGDLGRITTQDLLILISYSGNTKELKEIIKFSKLNKIKLIGIVSNKNSYLYKSANIKLLIPEVTESGLGIVPTSSTTVQLCLGDALAIAAMRQKKFGKLDFKKFHPAGNLGDKLKTASDIMLVKDKIPLVNENEKMKNALKVLNSKKLGFLVIVDKNELSKGIFTDGDLKRLMQKKKFIDDYKIKSFMTKNPYLAEKNTLAIDILKLMNKKKITNIGIYSKENKKKIIGVVHIHNLIKALN